MSDNPSPLPVTLEKAWHSLMTTIAIRNAGDATQQQIAIRGILRVMGRK